MEEEVPWYDSSKISLFQLCPKRYYYRHELHLVPIGGEETYSSALQFGKAIHKALETFYDNTAFERLPCVCTPLTGEQQLECPYHLQDHTTPKIIHTFLTSYPRDPEDDKDPRTRWNGAALLKAYIGMWQREAFTVEDIEVAFEIPFVVQEVRVCACEISGGCDKCENGVIKKQRTLFKYKGRIDLLIRDTDGRLKPWDHKTTKRFGDFWLEGFKLAHQQTSYMYASSQITGEEVTSGWINGLRVPTRTKPPEPNEEYFARIETSRTPADFDLWFAEIMYYHKLIEQSRREKVWPRSAPYACHAYNSRCPYYSLCTTHGDTQENIQTNSYEVSPWNPQDAD